MSSPLISSSNVLIKGVFYYAGESQPDNFIGHVVIDIAQISSEGTITTSLPLRKFSQIYSKEKLGSIHLRLSLDWKQGGERAALLSYFPARISDIAKRRKSPPKPVTVLCPDSKTFRNVALTVYGNDIPGKRNAKLRVALMRELKLFRRMTLHRIPQTAIDIIAWKNPFYSIFAFCGWMWLAWGGSGPHVIAFAMSAVLLFMMRNYLRYCNLAAGTAQSERTITDMTWILLGGNNSDLPMLRRLFTWAFGVRGSTNGETWRNADHAEFPFSVASANSKRSPDEAACTVMCKCTVLEMRYYLFISDASILTISTGMFLLFDAGEASAFDVDGCSRQDYKNTLQRSQSAPGKSSSFAHSATKSLKRPLIRFASRASRLTSTRNARGDATGQEELSEIESIDFLDNEHDSADDRSVVPTLYNDVILIEQDIDKKNQGSSETIADSANRIHRRVQKSKLHLFDDRIFIADDKADAEKVLRMNQSMNPVVKRINPIISIGNMILSQEVYACRAIFNILMWKDPMLSYIAMGLLLCSIIFVLIFPWRQFFLLVGLVGLGPQNYFLNVRDRCERYHTLFTTLLPRSLPNSHAKAVQDSGTGQVLDQGGAIQNSPLLFRNNVQMKPGGKRREVIVPSAPCRYNRFYDWPPHPESTIIKPRE